MTRIRQTARGFTLLEALVALVVMGFGMLALTSLQISLSRNADVAKQRTEALRLAQDRMEALRSFTGISTGTVNWDGLSSSSDSISSYNVGSSTVGTNTTYTRTWTLGGTSADRLRAATVQVSWTDRAGSAQSVSISSVIAQHDPAQAAYLTFPLPQNTHLKRPKNRNLNIPIQAISLGGGKSAFRIASDYSVVFSDTSGGVVQICTNLDATGSNYASASCTDLTGYILAGYVSGSVTTSGSTPTMPTGINTQGITGTNGAIKCSYIQATNTNSGAAISGYHYYLCVIPVATGSGYAGTLRLGGVSTSSNYKVCRFQYAATMFVNSNERNVQPYSNVQMSLDNQNYYIDSSNSPNCPTIDSVSGESISGDTVSTVSHQDCRSTASPTTGATGTCPATAHNTL